MSPLTLELHQSADHVAVMGETITVDGDPFIVREIKPQRELGVFLDFNRAVQYRVVIATIERFDAYDS